MAEHIPAASVACRPPWGGFCPHGLNRPHQVWYEDWPDELEPFIKEQSQDPNFSYHYGRASVWAEAQALPWWRRLLLRRIGIPPSEWPGTDPEAWGEDEHPLSCDCRDCGDVRSVFP